MLCTDQLTCAGAAQKCAGLAAQALFRCPRRLRFWGHFLCATLSCASLTFSAITPDGLAWHPRHYCAPPSFAALTTPASPKFLRAATARSFAALTPRRLARVPGTPTLLRAAVAHCVRYPGIPADWCPAPALSASLVTPSAVTPRLDLGVHFTCRLAEVVAVCSPALLQADNSNGLQDQVLQ